MMNSANVAINTGNYSSVKVFGPWVMVSGQGPINAAGDIVSGSIEDETRLTLENIRKHLESVGAKMGQVVKCNCYLQSIEDFDRFDKVYGQVFGTEYPCRTTVQAGLLGIKVEIDAQAWVGSDESIKGGV